MCSSTSNKVLSNEYVCRDTNAAKNMIKLFKSYPIRPKGYNTDDKVSDVVCIKINDKVLIQPCLV